MRKLVLLSVLFLLAACSPGAPAETTVPQPTESLPPPQVVTNSPEPTPIPADPTSPASFPEPFPSYLGAEINRFEDLEWARRAVESGVQLVRHNGILWSDIEPEPGERRWEALAEIEPTLAYLGENGVETILIVRSAPPFAQREPGILCGPIALEAFPAYADFLSELVARYSQPPYNVRYWELGNEPDVQYDGVPPDQQFGCWGDPQAEDFGGGYYAEMLKVAYQAIKTADPQAQVLIGGLLLDCDPDNPLEGRTCIESRFLEGILQAGGGDYFDAVSFHAYAFFTADGVFEDTIPNWEVRGGVLLGKINFLQSVLAAYNLDKSLFLTEAALTCPEWSRICDPLDEDFFEVQAQYVPRVYLRSWANGVDGTIWYPLDGRGWRQSGLAGQAEDEKPSLAAFEYMADRLGEAKFVRTVQADSQFLVYEFQVEEGRVQTIWTPDWAVRRFSLPDGVGEISDVYGQPVTAEGNEVLVDGVLYLTLPANQ